uniref:Uncharacterized protein n=1 Tax=Glossina pallidipes TaxID=7398 RepID=A0A1B0AD94_GLOPL
MKKSHKVGEIAKIDLSATSRLYFVFGEIDMNWGQFLENCAGIRKREFLINLLQHLSLRAERFFVEKTHKNGLGDALCSGSKASLRLLSIVSVSLLNYRGILILFAVSLPWNADDIEIMKFMVSTRITKNHK